MKSENLLGLLNLIKNEEDYQIQILSLESVEVFEYFLGFNNIVYIKAFTSKFKNTNSSVKLLLEDSKFEYSLRKHNQRILLYSNDRNYSFIPFYFQLTLKEKLNLIKKRDFMESLNWSIPIEKVQMNPKTSLTALSKEDPNLGKFISNSISHIQSIILMSVMKECKLFKIFNEVKVFDPALENSFLIKLELNELVENRMISKNGDNYRLNLSNETIMEICKLKKYDEIYK